MSNALPHELLIQCSAYHKFPHVHQVLVHAKDPILVPHSSAHTLTPTISPRAKQVQQCLIARQKSDGRCGMQVAVGTAAQAMEMQRKGARQRQKASTALNYHSSRSHSVFTVCDSF